MNKIFLIILCCTCIINNTFAEKDYMDNYTLIDCIEGDDNTGIVYDSSKPYQTLKRGIESSITHANNSTATGTVFKIYVICGATGINKEIRLDFKGASQGNEILIQGTDKNSFFIENTYFFIPKDRGNIVFKNVNFINNSEFGYYFKFPNIGTFSSSGVKILDSYIKILPGKHLGYTYFKARKICLMSCRYEYYNEYNNYQNIENSLIDIEVNADSTFLLPGIIKNSKINFINTSTGTINNITLSQGYGNISPSLISNEFDFGENIGKIDDNSIHFINNKFSNFDSINFGINSYYFNNTFENTTLSDISLNKHLYNNIFLSGFTDGYDIFNFRKNYHGNNIGPKGIAWRVKKSIGNNYFEIDLNIYELYQEITGENIPKKLNTTYIIY